MELRTGLFKRRLRKRRTADKFLQLLAFVLIATTMETHTYTRTVPLSQIWASKLNSKDNRFWHKSVRPRDVKLEWKPRRQED